MEKREAVLAFLMPIKDINDTFRTLHEYITTNESVEESILNDIYTILTDACLEIEEADNTANISRLTSISDTIKLAKAQEEQERAQAQIASDDLLSMV